MTRFLDWVNGDAATEPVLKAALAHLRFVTIHPFDDGSGRIARAIADLLLARSEGSPQRFCSMSAQIREERDDYYAVLELTQQGMREVTAWMQWFLACLTRAIQGAQGTLAGVVERARYWERLREMPLNDRQRLVIAKLLEGFEGKLTTSKWAAQSAVGRARRARERRGGRTKHERHAGASGRRTAHEAVKVSRPGKPSRPTRGTAWSRT